MQPISLHHPIYIMAAVTTVVALVAFGALIWQLGPKDGRRWLLAGMVLLGTFMSIPAYYWVRLPLLVDPLESLLAQPAWKDEANSPLIDATKLCFAPLTEEPAKLVPWLLLLALGMPLFPSRKMVVPLALAAGLGFAVGEIWLVASFVEKMPKAAGFAWYEFTGFFNERLMTCFSHSLFALPTIYFSRKGWKWAFVGLFIGMVLHWFGNAPIVLKNRGAFGLKEGVWLTLISIWLIWFVVATLIAVMAVHFHKKVGRIMARKMVCPECHVIYRQPIFLGVNMGTWRYEPCGACRKWHWVTIDNLAPVGAQLGATVDRQASSHAAPGA
jgi:hypothetical protein